MYVKLLRHTDIVMHFSTPKIVNAGFHEAAACGCLILEYPGPNEHTHKLGIEEADNCLFFNDLSFLVKLYNLVTSPDFELVKLKIQKRAVEWAQSHQYPKYGRDVLGLIKK